MTITIEPVATPTPVQWEAIRGLLTACAAHDGMEPRINPEMVRARPGTVVDDFLAWDDEQLVGYLGLYGFGMPEIEASGMVHPTWRRRGIFRQLADAALKECQRRGYQSRLWFSARASAAGMAWMQSLPTTFDHAEYAMMLRHEPSINPSSIHVELRNIEPEHYRFRHEVLAEAFGMPKESIDTWMQKEREEPHRRMELITADGEPAGVIGISTTDEDGYIFGFAVQASRRGQGIGRQALLQAVQRLQANKIAPIQLEVVTDNEHALGLYQSCGFEIVEAFDYFSEPIKQSVTV